MNDITNYIDKNFDRYLNELSEFIAIPSISTLPEYKKDMETCANFAENMLLQAGMTKVRIYKTEGNPIVYGEWLGAAGKPTVLIYGHYDVQPVDPLELWDSDPFKMVIKDDKIWARGANDNKGQSFTHLKSLEAFKEINGSLPVNIKILLEGEEEIGSESLTKFIKENKDLLKCDSVLISDTSLYEMDTPTINYGLRGLCYMEIELTGPNRDLHSGSFGGGVGNPINELAKMIAKLQDKNNKITIPGFYKDVVNLTKKERDNFIALKFSDRNLCKDLEVKELQGEKGYSTLERLSARPTLDCNGIIGGFTEEGAKTVLPSKASAKISMRLVPNQNPKTIGREFIKYVKSLTPKSMKIKVKEMHGGMPIVIPLDNEYVVAASDAVSKAFGKKTVYTREGGSIPIVVEFATQLKAPVVLMGFGLDSENIHSPNEHFHLKNFRRGILSSYYFLSNVGNF